MLTPRQQKQNEARRLLKKELDAFKEVRGCQDCEVSYPHYVLEFDHVPDRGKKIKTVSRLINSGTINGKKLQTEIAKCYVVCANCHRTRTWKRKNDESRITSKVD